MALTSQDNSTIQFNGSEYIDIPVDNFNISDEITIALWSYGNPDKLPRKTTLLEGVNDKNERQINIHFPWENSRIYWNCGPNNRLDKAASKSNFAGKWNHWTFTKNANTGKMKIYLNGNKWAEANDKTTLIDLKKLRIAASKDHSFHYFGAIDELSIWNKELSEDEIKNWMNKPIDNTHPSYSALKAYYQFDEASGLTISDQSPLQASAKILPNSTWKKVKGIDIFKGFIAKNTRPNIGFMQGGGEKTTSEIIVYDTISLSPRMAVSYAVENNDLFVVNNLGVEILNQHYPHFQSNDLEFDLSSLPKGIYYFTVKSNEGFDVKKVILE